MSKKKKVLQAVEKVEDTYQKVEDAYSKTAIGKFDKKLDDAFFSFIDKIFGW